MDYIVLDISFPNRREDEPTLGVGHKSSSGTMWMIVGLPVLLRCKRGSVVQVSAYLKPFTAKLLAADKWIQRDTIALGVASTSIRRPGGAYPLILLRSSLATGDNTECEKKCHRNIVTHRTAPLATPMQSNTRERSPSSPSKVGDIREAAPFSH